MSPLPEVNTGNTEPLYNIGVVARMTGVSMATLRAWERRYDFPESERTAGGHRLYSEHDVLRLRWVRDRIEEGMQTAQAINALRHQEATGHLVALAQRLPERQEMPKTMGSYMDVVRNRLVQALLKHDLPLADEIIGEALAVANIDEIILDLIGPSMAEIGNAWEAGDVGIATEHVGTNYLRNKLLLWIMSGPQPRPVSPIVLACGPNEWHEGSLLIIGALLRRRRWPVTYLGQSMPLSELADFIQATRPSLVVMVAMTEPSALELLEWPKWLPEMAASGRPAFGFGGRAFVENAELLNKMAGVYLGDDFRTAIEKIEELV
ncbi:MAG: MerR family transcriptional regulator [Anaerolineales bacterium]|nr:MerR family transcriptional regulator [Anaerolineales bacterium]